MSDEFDDMILAGLLVLTLILGVVVLIFSTATFGRKLADFEYQRQVGINGVRRIQCFINLRTYGLRIYLGLVFITLVLIVWLPLDPHVRTWTARLLFVSLAGGYAVASALDWMAEKEQQAILIREERQAQAVAGSPF